MIGQAWRTLRWALEDLGGLLRDAFRDVLDVRPPTRPPRRSADSGRSATPGTANRPVGVCSTCGETVHYSPVARLACCAKGCTVITRAELEDGALKC